MRLFAGLNRAEWQCNATGFLPQQMRRRCLVQGQGHCGHVVGVCITVWSRDKLRYLPKNSKSELKIYMRTKDSFTNAIIVYSTKNYDSTGIPPRVESRSMLD